MGWFRRGGLVVFALGMVAVLGAGDAPAAASARPDLVVGAAKAFGTSLQAGHPMIVKDTVRNAGRRRAGKSSTSYYLASTRTRTPEGARVGRRAVLALGAGRRSAVETVVVVPATTAPGAYFLVACADAARRVREKSERNNCRASRASFTVTAPPVTAAPLPAPTLPAAPDNRRPVAGFTLAPASPVTGETVELTSTSSDPDGSIASHAWELDGDFDYDDAIAPLASLSYPQDGTFAIFLRVTDDRGGVDLAGRTVTVGNRAPDAEFAFSPQSPLALEEVDFTAIADDADGTIASLTWDFDGDLDFEDATGDAPSHAFPAAGIFTVRLRATDDDGEVTTVARDVAVGPPANVPPVAGFDWTPANPEAGQRVSLTSSSTDSDGSITAYGWDLDGDADFDDFAGTQWSDRYVSGGTFRIGLRVTDDDGATHTVFRDVVVTGAPNPDRDGDGVENGWPGEYDQYDCGPDDPATYPGAPDTPGGEFADTDCDGIDGDLAQSIVVSKSDTAGNDSGCGQMEGPGHPCATIAHGLARATTIGRGAVLVAEGTYEEAISLIAGKSIYGGYASEADPSGRWERFASRAATTIVNRTSAGGRLIGVSANGIGTTNPMTLQNLTVRAGSATASGTSVYGVHAQNSPGLTLQSVDVEAGNGGPGTGGRTGLAGADGPAGAPGKAGQCPGLLEGGGGAGGSHLVGPDLISGGGGGSGGADTSGAPDSDAPGAAGGPGQPANGGAAGGGGGAAGLAPAGAGGDGTDGGPGAAGTDGVGASSQSGTVSGFFWSSQAGASGAPGSNGAGAGGGGGGGAPAGSRGNGGGGGGAGAGGGGPGFGGNGGGGSFGLFAVNSTPGPGPVLSGVRLASGFGGAGGAGGIGGLGGDGGLGGAGAVACPGIVGAGGDGGRGGDGGHGGHGGGGAGGASVAYFRSGVTTGIPAGAQLVPSPGGPGGSSLGNPGVAGVSQASN